MERGGIEGRNPNPRLNWSWYLAQNQSLTQHPLAHYLDMGERCRVMDVPWEILRRPPPLLDRNVCLFVSYTPHGEIHEHVLMLLRALRLQGLTIVLVLATDGLTIPLPLELDGIVDGLMVRTNHGWDFAAWAAALATFPDLWRARSLILTNDSLYGPVDEAALAEVVRRVKDSKSDLVTLVDSYQAWHHLMSFFVGITSSGLKKDPVRRFWCDVQSIQSKLEVIKAYELTSARFWKTNDVMFEVLFPTNQTPDPPTNPTLTHWRELLRRGFPFIKVQLLRDERAEFERPSRWREDLSGNPGLVAAIDRHLVTVARPAVPVGPRPMPPPRRRFRRGLALANALGATESMRPTDETDLAIEVPFTAGLNARRLPGSLAVLAHIFYPEMTEELFGYLNNVPGNPDVFITTDSPEKKAAIEALLRTTGDRHVEIRIVPNVGRDIAAMLVGLADVIPRYDFILHIHSKRSPHNTVYRSWRNFLLQNLLGSPEIVKSVSEILSRPDIGIVFSQHLPEIRPVLNWGFDFDLARNLLGRAGIALTRNTVLEFPSSSFFWARSAALAPLLELGLDWSDFPPEEGQIDGTIAHAIERSLLLFAEKAGYRWVKVASPALVDPSTLVPVPTVDRLDSAITAAFRPLIGNRLAPYQMRTLCPEVPEVATRRDVSTRRRLNLIIPSIHPKQIFGGVSTALRIFNELAEEFGSDATDLRIVCLTTPDIEAMANFSSYVQVGIGALNDDFPRTIVDVTDGTGGELPVRAGDLFLVTAWWTAVLGFDLQDCQCRLFGPSDPVIYLIQDHEPDFYGWSSHYGRAQSTYAQDARTLAIINSEELTHYMSRRYGLSNAFVARYAPNPKIRAALTTEPRERILLFYGRPSTARNCFTTIVAGLALWQQSEPTIARRWTIVSAGEEYDEGSASAVVNLDIRGKLSLSDYGSLLSRASVGISLMLSPHPSYPPLEMAHAGLKTITNGYECKDLRQRSDNIISLDTLTPEALADAISSAIAIAEQTIGQLVPFSEVKPLSCGTPPYSARAVAGQLSPRWSARPNGDDLDSTPSSSP